MIRKIHCIHHTSLRCTLMTHNAKKSGGETVRLLAFL